MAAKAGRILEEFEQRLVQIELASGYTQGMDAPYLETDDVFALMRQSKELLETIRRLVAQAKEGESIINNIETAEACATAWFELPEARRDEYQLWLKEQFPEPRPIPSTPSKVDYQELEKLARIAAMDHDSGCECQMCVALGS